MYVWGVGVGGGVEEQGEEGDHLFKLNGNKGHLTTNHVLLLKQYFPI